MTTAPSFFTLDGCRLEYRRIPAADPALPVLVFLHEGLGSISLWRDFPDRLAAATGAGALIYSRRGYGRSDPQPAPFATGYLEREAAEILPRVLDHFGITRPILIGHSDGGSIALLFAALAGRPLAGAVTEAAHVFVEDITLAGIRDAVTAWETTDLRARLARHHADPDHTFGLWAEVWLSPPFAAWNIEAHLPRITAPLLVIQGEGDEYGTPEQVHAIVRQTSGPAEPLLIPACGHTPHRDQADAVLAAMADFVRRVA